MADEPTLPQLPKGGCRPAPPLFGRGSGSSNGRKRGRDHSYGTGAGAGSATPSSLFSTSSDPAVFSSDDDPALDNYMHGARRKKRYVGSWFDQQLAASSDSIDSAMGDDMHSSSPLVAKPPRPRQRHLRRQMDSGVWMAQGDSTDYGEFSDSEVRASKIPISSPTPVSRLRFSIPELEAQGRIQECIDEGKDAVDLSHLGLETISGSILEPINQIAPIPLVAKGVAFEQRNPSVKLYLGGNALRQFPQAIINIEHLTVLSLRGNALTELPPALASLKHLQSLNVAQNLLRYLPGELLGLMERGSRLREVLVHPNPFFQAAKGLYCPMGDGEYEKSFRPSLNLDLEESWEGITTRVAARTPVQFSDSTRIIHSTFQLPRLSMASEIEVELENFWIVSTPETATASQAKCGRESAPAGAPSLLELVLRSAARFPDARSVVDAMDEAVEEQFLRPGHKALLERALELHQMGGQPCCVCGREGVLNPVTEWIEFRRLLSTKVHVPKDGSNAQEVSKPLSHNETWVPFVRRGCSWKCIPIATAAPSHEEESWRWDAP